MDKDYSDLPIYCDHTMHIANQETFQCVTFCPLVKDLFVYKGCKMMLDPFKN